jgi:hypothetical protein
MQLERKPEPGQTWQHFKGNIYKILLISEEYWKLDQILDFPREQIKHTETGELCTLGVQVQLDIDPIITLIRKADGQTIEGKL